MPYYRVILLWPGIILKDVMLYRNYVKRGCHMWYCLCIPIPSTMTPIRFKRSLHMLDKNFQLYRKCGKYSFFSGPWHLLLLTGIFLVVLCFGCMFKILFSFIIKNVNSCIIMFIFVLNQYYVLLVIDMVLTSCINMDYGMKDQIL